MTFLISLFSFVLVFVIVAMAHEIGHFIWAKRAGIRVLEFGIGYGPNLLKKEHGGTVYSLNLMPVLAFVRLAGIDDENDDEKNCPDKEKYFSKTPLQKLKSIVAGPLMNLVLGFIIYSLLAMTFGLPQIGPVVDSVAKNSPAQKAGLLSGDKIVAIDGKRTSDMAFVIEKIHESSKKEISLTVMRNNSEVDIKAVPVYDKKLKAALLGFALKTENMKYNPLEAVWAGATKTAYLSYMIVGFLGKLLIGKIALTDVAGPIGIAQFSGQAAMQGLPTFLNLLAFISINLGVFNLLPIPALDGGRIVFILIEWIRKKPIDIETENRFHQWGLIVLLLLVAAVSFNDIARFIKR